MATTLEFVNQLPSDQKKELLELNEVPNKIRFLVEAAPNMASKVATLEKFYTKVEPLQGNNFIVTDEKGDRYQLDNKNKTNLADAIDLGKEATEMVGSIIGTAKGAVAGSAVPVVGTAAGAVVGSGVGMAAGAELFERVGQMYGAEILRTNKEWAAQRGTDFAFGSVGQAVVPLILKPLKGSITGFGKKGVETAKRLEDYIDAGVTPSLGQVTQKRGLQTVELLLGNFPGSSGKIAAVAGNAQKQLGDKVLSTAKNLIKKPVVPDESIVGRALINSLDGLNNPKSFVGMFNAKANTLFGKIDKFIKKDALIDLSKGKGSTLNTIRSLVDDIPGAKNVGDQLKSPFLKDLFGNLQKDMVNGQLPYAAVKSIKQKIGKKMASFDLVPDVEKGQLKLIYKALSEDLKIAAKKYGSDTAVKQLDTANKFYQKGLQRIEDYLQPIVNITDPDKLVMSLLSSGKEGATRLNAVRNSLAKVNKEASNDSYKILVSNILERMGRMQPAQTFGGDTVMTAGRFSSETFLTNFSKLSDQAKKTLFKSAPFGKEFQKNLQQVVNIADNIRASGKTFANPSGTADRLVGQGLIFGGGATAFTGNPAFILSVPLVIGSARVTAGLMTNPNFIKWLAQGIKITGNKGADGVIQHLGKLGTIMANADSETRQFIYEYLQMLQGKKEE
jgi:hypothetical protein